MSRGEQFGHPPVVMRRDLDDTELVVGDGGAELGGQANASAPLRIGQQVTDLVTASDGITLRDQLLARNSAHRA